MNTTAQTTSAAAESAAIRSEQSASPTSEARPTFPFHPSRILSLRETFEAGAALPDEELQVFLEGFKEELLYEHRPWMAEVMAGDIREIGHAKYRIGWRHGLLWGIPIGIPIGSLATLLAVAIGMHWAAA
jgi:hypothetical protein